MQVDGDNTTSTNAKLIVTGSGNVGVGTANPGTTLDVNGALTNRETEVTVSGNAVTIPANTSMVRITGTATNSISVTVPAAPKPGQRLIVFNNTVGGFGSVLNSISVPNGKALEFVYSGGGWQSINTINAPAILPYASSSPVTLTTIAGGLAGAIVAAFFGDKIRAFFHKKRTPKEETKKHPIITKLWNKYGIAGLGILGTITVGAPISIAVGTGLNVNLKKLLLWCCLGVIIRCGVFSAIGYYGLQLV